MATLKKKDTKNGTSRKSSASRMKKPLSGSSPYLCSKCGLTVAPRNHIPKLPLSAKPTREKAREWYECPEGGPETAAFCDEPLTQVRMRGAFAHGNRGIRVCSRWWIEERLNSRGIKERKGTHAYSMSDLRDKWYVQRALEQNDRGDIDLGNLPLPVRDNETVGRGIFQTRPADVGLWLLHPTIFTPFTQWQIAVLQHCKRHAVDLEWVHEALTLLNPHHGQSDRYLREARKATLFVPLDLRFSLESSLERILPHVKAIQDNVLAMAGREGVIPNEDADLAWRDIYIYLQKGRGLSAAKIAKEVFPKENPRSRASKVRTILTRTKQKVGDLLDSATQTTPHLSSARISDAPQDK